MHRKFTPNRVFTQGARAAVSGLTVAVALWVGYAFNVHPLDERPHLVVMGFFLASMVAGCGAVVAAVSAVTLQLHQAFTAGYKVGMSRALESSQPAPVRPVLRAVADETT